MPPGTRSRRRASGAGRRRGGAGRRRRRSRRPAGRCAPRSRSARPARRRPRAPSPRPRLRAASLSTSPRRATVPLATVTATSPAGDALVDERLLHGAGERGVRGDERHARALEARAPRGRRPSRPAPRRSRARRARAPAVAGRLSDPAGPLSHRHLPASATSVAVRVRSGVKQVSSHLETRSGVVSGRSRAQPREHFPDSAGEISRPFHAPCDGGSRLT